MTTVSFATEDDYLRAMEVVKDELRVAVSQNRITMEYQYERDDDSKQYRLIDRDTVLNRLAFDIVSKVARSSIPVSGDISDVPGVEITQV